MKKIFTILAFMYLWLDIAQAQRFALPAEKKDTLPTKTKAIMIEPKEELPPVVIEKPNQEADTNIVYKSVQQQPEFVGEGRSQHKYLARNFRYPKSAMENNIQGKVFVKFIVEKDGTLTNIEILKGISNCKECNEEALRLVRGMPKWEPGKQNGNPVRVSYQIPIIFKLEQ